jgi:hypothetical protein
VPVGKCRVHNTTPQDDSGIVDQNVNPSELVIDSASDSPPVLLAGDIERKVPRIAPGRAQFLDQFMARSWSHVARHDGRTHDAEQSGRCGAQPHRRTSDERDLARKPWPLTCSAESVRRQRLHFRVEV